MSQKPADKMPVRRRIVVPELPQSSGWLAAFRPKSPVPFTRNVVLSRVPISSIIAPIARMQFAVETLSSP